ncbi:hypothetical protein OIU78_022365 [Salix suchowensis]|nr:hypothetical protein OIU78_022365 [Salix suchowensis]
MACAISILLIAIFSFSSPNFVAYAQNDTLKQGQLLRDDEQLISAGGIFRLGFFSADSNAGLIGTAGARYLGIWFEHIPVYSVWVANRDTPVPDSSGGLTIGDNITATLLDSGNLVVRRVDYDGKPAGPVLWQSFDDLHNMLLPGMRLRVNLRARKNLTLNSWSSEEVPAPGAFMRGRYVIRYREKSQITTMEEEEEEEEHLNSTPNPLNLPKLPLLCSHDPVHRRRRSELSSGSF